MHSISPRTLLHTLQVVLFITTPVALSAQRATDLVLGTRVRVTSHGQVTDGAFVRLKEDSIIVLRSRYARTFAFSETESVDRLVGYNRTKSMLRTAAKSSIIGTALGAAIGAASYKPCENLPGLFDCAFVPNSRPRATVFGAAVFGVSSLLVGGLVGAARAPEIWAPVSFK